MLSVEVPRSHRHPTNPLPEAADQLARASLFPSPQGRPQPVSRAHLRLSRGKSNFSFPVMHAFRCPALTVLAPCETAISVVDFISSSRNSSSAFAVVPGFDWIQRRGLAERQLDREVVETKRWGNAQTSTGVACAIFPTSSSACIIFFIRAATGFFFGGMVPFSSSAMGSSTAGDELSGAPTACGLRQFYHRATFGNWARRFPPGKVCFDSPASEKTCSHFDPVQAVVEVKWSVEYSHRYQCHPR